MVLLTEITRTIYSIDSLFTTAHIIIHLQVKNYYVSPMKWGDILFLAPLSVCPSVRQSVRLSVTLSCPLYIF